MGYGSLFMQKSYEKKKKIPNNLCKIVITTCEVFICYEIILGFLQCSNIYKLSENNTHFVVLSIVLVTRGTILPVVREITPIKNVSY